MGSEAAGRRPAVIVQDNSFNRSKISTVIVVPFTTNMRLGDAPGNVVASKRRTGLPSDSIINISQVGAIDRRRLLAYHGALEVHLLGEVSAGLQSVLSL